MNHLAGMLEIGNYRADSSGKHIGIRPSIQAIPVFAAETSQDIGLSDFLSPGGKQYIAY